MMCSSDPTTSKGAAPKQKMNWIKHTVASMNDALINKYWDLMKRVQPHTAPQPEVDFQRCADSVVRQINLQMMHKVEKGRVSVAMCNMRLDPADARLLRALQATKTLHFGLDPATQEVVWQKK